MADHEMHRRVNQGSTKPEGVGAPGSQPGPVTQVAVYIAEDDKSLGTSDPTYATTTFEKPSGSIMSFTKDSTVLDLSQQGHLPGHSTWVSGFFHLVTVMIGAGVLSLPSSMALLGWVLGPILLLIFGAATVWSSYMLADVFEVDGQKHYTYKDAVGHIMGGNHPYFLATIQYINMFLAAVGYTLAGMTSIQFIAHTSCGLEAPAVDPCPLTFNAEAILVFSGLQLILNMCPNLESIWWVSAVGAIMSYLYSTLAIALSAHSLSTDGMALDTTTFGKPAETPWLRAIGMFGALGNLAFAWSAGLMIISIQSTLREPPKAVISMRKTILASYSSTAMYYFLISLLGYAALGSTVPGDVLVGFNVSKQVELLANAAVLGHMIAAVQVYMHPIYEAIEMFMADRAPMLVDGSWRTYAFRAVYRSLWTVAITGVGYGLPHFALISGLNGAVTFWPLQIFYPFAMFMKAFPPSDRIKRLMYVVATFLGVVCILATVGSVYALATIGSSH